MVKIDQKPERRFPVICAWCGAVCYFSTCEHSHGICENCKEIALADLMLERDRRGRSLFI